MLSIVSNFVYQKKILSLKVLKTFITLIPITKGFAEKILGIVEQMYFFYLFCKYRTFLEKTRLDKHVYNMSTQVISTYLMIFCNNIKTARGIAKVAINSGETQGFKETEKLQSEATGRVFGISCLYNSEITYYIAEAQFTECILKSKNQRKDEPTVRIPGISSYIEKMQFEMDLSVLTKRQIVYCINCILTFFNKFVVWDSLLNEKYKDNQYDLIKNVTVEINKITEQWKSGNMEQELLVEIEKKAYAKISTLDFLLAIMLRSKDDQPWLYKTVVTKIFEYLPNKNVDMLLKSECINILRQIIDIKNIDQHLLKPGYLWFHSFLVSLLASSLDSSMMNPLLYSGLANPTIIKWDLGLWKFSTVLPNSDESEDCLDPANYGKLPTKIIGPKNLLDSEYLIKAIHNSFKLVGNILNEYGKSQNISPANIKPIIDMVNRAYILFQGLSEIKLPCGIWQVTKEIWENVTMQLILDTKAELLKIINSQIFSQNAISPMAKEMVFLY